MWATKFAPVQLLIQHSFRLPSGMGGAASARKRKPLSPDSSSSDSSPEELIVTNWVSRRAAYNDTFLRKSFARLLAESAKMPLESKALAYDACDGKELTAALGNGRRKRLDARRNAYSKREGPKQVVHVQIKLFMHSLALSLTHSRTHALTHSHTLTHALTHSLDK